MTDTELIDYLADEITLTGCPINEDDIFDTAQKMIEAEDADDGDCDVIRTMFRRALRAVLTDLAEKSKAKQSSCGT